MLKDTRCVICGDIGTIEHHTDYVKNIKIDVCRSCHPRIHSYGLEEMVKDGKYLETHNLIRKIISKKIMIHIKEYAYEELVKVTGCDLSESICNIIDKNKAFLEEKNNIMEENKGLAEQNDTLKEEVDKLKEKIKTRHWWM